ncbi:unnamed protein product [Clonostachys solani]|uniref:Amino acid permease/ SLC12A domain-containing protein n=1 Tax=Clonostachys solani TaxID=160281 RepID=A0A9N9ZFI3_9HYPO|nr:unnamed protein product [Clonostachys solani]
MAAGTDLDKIEAGRTVLRNDDQPHDILKGDMDNVPENFSEIQEMKQGLHTRHVSMIALCGAIGTGLFLASGRTLAKSGPLGALLAYLIVGIAGCCVTLDVGEMGALVPLSGGIVRYSEIFVEPALSFANGWNLVLKGLIVIPAEITATAVLMKFWLDISSAAWITLFGGLTIITSSLLVRVYGELEFVFGLLKILLILVIDIMAIVITSGGGPDGQVIGFKYWGSPGPFVQYLGVQGSLGQFLGFWSACSTVIFAYSGIETISLTAAETRNPRVAIPRAAKRVFWRVLIFYVITIFMVGMIVPSDNPQLLGKKTTASSPFVIAATLAGIGGIPHFINAIVITSAWSSGNSMMLHYTRYLYGMAKKGHAPRLFTRLNRFRVPWINTLFFGSFIGLAYMSTSAGAATIFTWLQDLASVAITINWIVILITYLRFYYGCKAQGINRHEELPYASPFQPYFSWAALTFFSLLLLTGGFSTFMTDNWDTHTFVSSYVNIPIIIIIYTGYKVLGSSKIIPLAEIPIRPFIQVYRSEPLIEEKPKTGFQKLNILWS